MTFIIPIKSALSYTCTNSIYKQTGSNFFFYFATFAFTITFITAIRNIRVNAGAFASGSTLSVIGEVNFLGILSNTGRSNAFTNQYIALQASVTLHIAIVIKLVGKGVKYCVNSIDITSTKSLVRSIKTNKASCFRSINGNVTTVNSYVFANFVAIIFNFYRTSEVIYPQVFTVDSLNNSTCIVKVSTAF